MDELTQDLQQLSARYREGSLLTQANRANVLAQMPPQLRAAGCVNISKAGEIKDHHVSALVETWLRQGLAPSTLRNKVAVLRWWATKVDKADIVPKSNAVLGIKVCSAGGPAGDDAGAVDDSACTAADEYVQVSVELQACFGLTPEESIKFVPNVADAGDRIKIRASWGRMGVAREVPVRTVQQKAVLARAHALANSGSLIPESRNYPQHWKVYERNTKVMGAAKIRGLRRQYAQNRYAELAGMACSLLGGTPRTALRDDQKTADELARKTVAREMGIRNVASTVTVLGR